jgi:hypothetical protein
MPDSSIPPNPAVSPLTDRDQGLLNRRMRASPKTRSVICALIVKGGLGLMFPLRRERPFHGVALKHSPVEE